ncbi:MAG: shikimate kinase [Bacilli bacterium]
MKYGLIGERLDYSYSKFIHEKMHFTEYTLKEISKEDLAEYIKAKNYKGLNVTIPYKETVIDYLDVLSENVKKTNVVNTIVNHFGELRGYNTDYDGFMYLIKSHNVDIHNKTCIILGTGATSRTITLVLNDLGAKLIKYVSRTKVGKNIINYDRIDMQEADILINTTPVGVYPSFADCPINIDKITGLKTVIDVIYNPLRSRLLVNAELKGLKAINGLSMLVYQAKCSSELFFDKIIDDCKVQHIIKSIQKNNCNIVLIGMPGAGKSRTAHELMHAISFRLCDSDNIIIKEEKISIKNIFKQYGEQYFRDKESKVISNLALNKGMIIATGGGVVLRENNMKLLKSNGIILFLDKDVEKIAHDTQLNDKRPLTMNKEQLYECYKTRYPLYKKYSDIIINISSNQETKDIVEIIKKALNEI